MNILQLTCFTDLWPEGYEVVSIDLKNGIDVLEVSDDIGKEFDFIIAAPPCDQFTVANNRNWEKYPKKYIDIADKCFKICMKSGVGWVLEQTPGRIEKFLPDLKKYRIGIWKSSYTRKKHVIYSNKLFLLNEGCGKIDIPRSKKIRQAWQWDFVDNISKFV